MTDLEIQLLKESVDRTVEIETIDGERLIARVLFVSQSEEYDEHDLLYEAVSSNKLDSYAHLENSGGYVLDFEKILSVKPHPDLGSQKPGAGS